MDNCASKATLGQVGGMLFIGSFNVPSKKPPMFKQDNFNNLVSANR